MELYACNNLAGPTMSGTLHHDSSVTWCDGFGKHFLNYICGCKCFSFSLFGGGLWRGGAYQPIVVSLLPIIWPAVLNNCFLFLFY